MTIDRFGSWENSPLNVVHVTPVTSDERLFAVHMQAKHSFAGRAPTRALDVNFYTDGFRLAGGVGLGVNSEKLDDCLELW